MPRKCAVPGCRSNRDTKQNYTACYRFPKDQALRKKWIQLIHRQGFEPTPEQVVCIKHFESKFIIDEDKYPNPNGTVTVIRRRKTTLVKDAYPTLFLDQPTYSTGSTKLKENSSVCEIRNLAGIKIVKLAEVKEEEILGI